MYVILVLTSMTYAMKAQGLLNEHGIKGTLTRNTQTRKIRGCGYGLQIEKAYQAKAVLLLNENGITVAGSVEVKNR